MPDAPCPTCGKVGAKNEDPALAWLGAGPLTLCACGTVHRHGVAKGRASLGPDGRPGVRPDGMPPRKFRYLGFGHFRITKGTP